MMILTSGLSIKMSTASVVDRFTVVHVRFLLHLPPSKVCFRAKSRPYIWEERGEPPDN
jgi:hypothetical protein